MWSLSFAALLVELVDCFMGDVIHPGRKAVGRILAGGAFRRIQLWSALSLVRIYASFIRSEATAALSMALIPFSATLVLMPLPWLHLLSRRRALFLQQLCHNHHPPVCPGILAGGKGDKLVAIFRAYARIVKRQRLALGNIPVKSPGALRIDKVVILEASSE